MRSAGEHDAAARRLRRVAGRLADAANALRLLPDTGNVHAGDCVARAIDALRIARDHVERDAREHERAAVGAPE